MIHAVLDTNILVSALLTAEGVPARAFDHALSGDVVLCYDSRILAEYRMVLARPRFGFERHAVRQVLDFIESSGISIVPAPSALEFPDTDDRKFFETAEAAGAYLVTGNIRHYPQRPWVVTPRQFVESLVPETS